MQNVNFILGDQIIADEMDNNLTTYRRGMKIIP